MGGPVATQPVVSHPKGSAGSNQIPRASDQGEGKVRVSKWYHTNPTSRHLKEIAKGRRSERYIQVPT
jgi:hypothetical protein